MTRFNCEASFFVGGHLVLADRFGAAPGFGEFRLGDADFLLGNFDMALQVGEARIGLVELRYLCGEPDAMTHPEGMQIKVSRQELSRLVGCSREMAGRVLKVLEEQGLLRATGKTIVVFNARPKVKTRPLIVPVKAGANVGGARARVPSSPMMKTMRMTRTTNKR